MIYNEPHPLEVRVLTRRYEYPQKQPIWIDQFLATQGYEGFRKALGMTTEQILDEVMKSNLRGRGGAGFPAGMKWKFLDRRTNKPRYIVANADESEPGTCKDRIIIEGDPHRLIEGMLIAGFYAGAHRGWIYVRGEYRRLIEILDRAIDEAYQRGFLGKNLLGSGFDFDLSTQSGAGAYECGEESALLESLEGKRGNPRIKPPFPASVGAFQCPTILNNVETFASVPDIIVNGGEWYANLGTPKNGGTRLFCLSGHVNKPGVYELPMGFNLLRMINEIGGGIRGGRKLKAVIPGGSSCPVLKAEECDVAMDHESIARLGSMLGSGGVVIMDETADMVKAMSRIMKFYAHESCGWCIPCREGTTWLKKILMRLDEGVGTTKDVDMVYELAQNMFGRTFCPLGDAAAMPAMSFVQKFRGEFEAKIKSSQVFVPAPDTSPLAIIG